MADNQPKERDTLSGVETTGHEWDGLKELNNPAPRWWLWVFFVTVVWAIGYWVLFPAWPTISGNTKGTQGWTQYKKLHAEHAEILEIRGEHMQQLKHKSLQEIAADPALSAFAIAGGRTIFMENCAACHGSGAEGKPGYPNLNDDDWLWGGSLDAIYTTLRYGIRSGHSAARTSQMPAFGRDGLLNSKQISDLSEHVLSLSGRAAPNARGAELFAQNCVACHGAQGKGDRTLGAPNLADAIWLYGGSKKEISAMLTNAYAGVMPNWEERLGADRLKQLTLYVHSLGGGEPDAPAAEIAPIVEEAK